MKTKVLLSILACFIATIGIAQNTVLAPGEEYLSAKGPFHPLASYPYYLKFQADTIYYHSYTKNDTYFPTSYSYTIFKHSKDGLTDTIYLMSGASRIEIIRYNEKGQVVSIIDADELLSPHDHNCYDDYNDYYHVEDYEYDSQGRLSKHRLRYVDLCRSLKDSIASETVYDYSTVQYTENGYIFDECEYEFDDAGRVTHIRDFKHFKILKPETITVDGKTYIQGEFYYTYTDGGLSVVSFDFSWPQCFVKSNYSYNEDGYVSSIQSYAWNGNEWEYNGFGERTYAYVDGSRPLSTENVEATATSVYGISGAIVVNAVEKAQISVYNTVGQVIEKRQAGAGATQIAVPKGLYFVTVDNKSYKVMAR